MAAPAQGEKARFIKGALLAWIPFLLVMIPAFANAFRGISSERATGLGAVAGGMAEGLIIFGFAAVLFSEVAAIILLAPTFSRQHPGLSFFLLLSLGCSGLMLALMGAFVWLLWARP